ncbi:hypothetical protein [Nannocystis punicea]|uniref:Peptidase C39-like domain-containing protein n=1 Tax=Nannocystis punicea TaxID=2995304 RepID=A0ABY7HHA1_9BACT|nr:hypothetical protein [Nannocystis poenicansa]WAS98259.1 hypothetical protein O0S08_19125 [Nannocystis poenicansa]
MRGPRGFTAGLALALACGIESSPETAPVDDPTPAPASVPPRPTVRLEPVDARDADLLARWPSLTHYPRVPPALAAGLRAHDPAAIFRGLELAFEPDRWAEIDAWERLGHIRLADPAGFCRTDAGQPVRLSPGTYDLGCLGGFLEGVRLLWLPRLELADLVPCDPPGGFESCQDGAHAGRAALLQIAARLPEADLPRGLDLLDLRLGELDPEAALAALVPGALHLCSVSHRAGARGGERMYHHMMIVDPTRDRLGRVHVFDTTGAAGVAWRAMRPTRLHRYARRLLARHDAFRYDPESARLTCLAVRPPAAQVTGP